MGGSRGKTIARVARASAVTRRKHRTGRWTGGRGRAVWGLGVGQGRLSTVLHTGDAPGATERVRRGEVRITSTLGTSPFHEPVMLSEVLSFLAPERGGLYLDGTLGGGGHARAILDSTEGASLLALDRDVDALEHARSVLAVYGDRVVLRQGDYADTVSIFDLGEGALAGVLLDLGVSSHQIDSNARGFSFRSGVPLDMRMSGIGVTAEELLSTLSADALAEIFRAYGEERRARRLAAAIVERRSCSRLRTSDDLVKVIEAVWGRPPAASDLARIFQALRIAVNEELASLERALPVLRDLLGPRGRMVVIAYHSLEDRLVKRGFRDWSRDCVCPPGIPVCRCRGKPLGRELTRGPVRPAAEEVATNSRARSALLRAWERGE
jgi:16S rRNA (cytosine1402-N4)-methyltransferase